MERSVSWNNNIIVNLAIALSIGTMVIYFFQNRSLFLDSLNLARNIAEGSYADFLHPLKYEQSAPILFLFLSKFTTTVFGISEYTLRFIPLLSGIGSVIFFSKLLQKWFDKILVFAGTLLFGSHLFILRYATEFKQYMTDTFVCIFIIWLCLHVNKNDRKSMYVLALAGTVAIWLSMPSVFVLFGSLLYLFFERYKTKLSLTPIFLLAFWFFANFMIEYYLILKPAIASSHMQNFHQNYFLQGKFWNMQSINHDFGLITAMIRLVVGKSGIAIGVSFILIITAIANFLKSKNNIGWIVLSPIFAVLFASLIGKYSLIERLILFTLPLILIIILWGANTLLKTSKTKAKLVRYGMILILGMSYIVAFLQTQGLKHVLNPFEIEDNRSSLAYISDHPEKDAPIVCTQLAFPAYEYYTNFDCNYSNLNLNNAVGAKYGESILTLVENNLSASDPTIWILMGHMSEEEISTLIDKLDKTGTIKNSYRTNKSTAILYSTQ